jgi:hypothetical protein
VVISSHKEQGLLIFIAWNLLGGWARKILVVTATEQRAVSADTLDGFPAGNPVWNLFKPISNAQAQLCRMELLSLSDQYNYLKCEVMRMAFFRIALDYGTVWK